MKPFHFPSWTGLAIMFLGIVFMAFGIFRGEMAMVFQKAIHICLECIGIG